MALDWDALADALARSPAVTAFAAGEGQDCRAGDVERWIALKDGPATVVCTVSAGTTRCRARTDEPDYLGCGGWSELRPTAAPEHAAPLIAVWAAHPEFEAAVEHRGLKPDSPFTAVSVADRRVVDGEVDSTTRLALRSSTGWHLSRQAIGGYEDVQYRESFDAAPTLSGTGWGVVSSAFDGCSRGGDTVWTLRLWREDGAWLTLAGMLDLGGSSFSSDDDGPGWSHGVRLGVTPLERGRLRLRVARDKGGPGAKEVRDKVGVWSLGEDGLVPVR